MHEWRLPERGVAAEQELLLRHRMNAWCATFRRACMHTEGLHTMKGRVELVDGVLAQVVRQA
jgi:hypothetical protein